MTLPTMEEEMFSTKPVLRGLTGKSTGRVVHLVDFSSVCEETAFLNGIERFQSRMGLVWKAVFVELSEYCCG
jgi:hypothetical protein